MKNGQINVGIAIAITTLLAGLITTSLGISWRSNDRADKATERVSSVEGDIKELKINIQWIKETLGEWKQLQVKEEKLSKDGTSMVK